MNDDLIMRKKPEQIEMEFQDSGESALVKVSKFVKFGGIIPINLEYITQQSAK